MSAPKPSSKSDSAKNVAIDLLRTAGEPLHVKEITKRVLASDRCAGLKGKTPDATIGAMLAIGSKRGGPFTRTDRATYSLTESPSTPERAKGKETPKQPSREESGPNTPVG